MYELVIIVRCPATFTDVTPDAMPQAELVIEALVSVLLLQTFHRLEVLRVQLTYTPASRWR